MFLRFNLLNVGLKALAQEGNQSTLKEIIDEMEDEVLANAGVDVFEEVFKL